MEYLSAKKLVTMEYTQKLKKNKSEIYLDVILHWKEKQQRQKCVNNIISLKKKQCFQNTKHIHKVYIEEIQPLLT